MKEMLFDRMPPQDIEVERALIGAILKDKDVMQDIVSVVRAEHFYNRGHMKIWMAAQTIYEKGSAVDYITVQAELKRRQELDEVGGTHYLIECEQSVPSAALVKEYSKIILDHCLRRQGIVASCNLTGQLYDSSVPVDEALAEADKISFLRQGSSFRRIRRPDEVLHSMIEKMEKSRENIRDITTGFYDLDQLIVELENEQLVCIGGRPGMGKTGFALALAMNNSKMIKKGVYFSLEQSDTQIARRMISARTGIDLHTIRMGTMNDESMQRYAGSIADVENLLHNIIVDDNAGVSTAYIGNTVRMQKKIRDIKYVIVDFIQLITCNGYNRHDATTTALKELKDIAKINGIPVIVVSQLSRAVESREAALCVPQLSDLRESGSFEEYCDYVFLLYRPEHYLALNKIKLKDNRDIDGSDYEPGTGWVLVAKAKDGAIGKVKLAYKKTTAMWGNLYAQVC